MCRAIFFRNGKPKTHHNTSSVWYGIKQYVHTIFQHSTWTIWNGEIVDSWHILEHFHISLNIKVADYIVEGKWNIRDYFFKKYAILVQQIINTTLPLVSTSNKLNWTSFVDGIITNEIAFVHLRETVTRFLGASSYGASMFLNLKHSFLETSS